MANCWSWWCYIKLPWNILNILNESNEQFKNINNFVIKKVWQILNNWLANHYNFLVILLHTQHFHTKIIYTGIVFSWACHEMRYYKKRQYKNNILKCILVRGSWTISLRMSCFFLIINRKCDEKWLNITLSCYHLVLP